MTSARSQTDIISYPIRAGGVTSRALECGTGDDVLVCLHGTGSRADRWRRNLPGLAAAGLHVYVVDFPGHGFAEKGPSYDYGSPAYAEFVTDFISQLAVPNLALAGTSLGGHVAVLVACQIPQRIRAVTYIGGVGLTTLKDVPRPEPPVVADSSPAGIRHKLEFLVYDKSLVVDSWVREESRINSSPGAVDALARLSKYSFEDDLVGDQYKALGIPTLLVWGKQDVWTPVEFGYRTHELLPEAPLVFIDHAGHAPYFERPETFNQVLLGFLRDPKAVEPGISTV